MEKITKNNEKIPFESIKPIELERVLLLYGMKKQTYCELHTKSKSWWYNVLIKRKFLTYTDIKILTESIGVETFFMLLEKVREQHNKKME